MAFPTLFPGRKGDQTNIAVLSDISNNSTKSFPERLKHLIKFAENIDGKWTNRFASHPRFAYWAYNIVYWKRILGQSKFFSKAKSNRSKSYNWWLKGDNNVWVLWITCIRTNAGG